jgi:hypothetical protein
MSGTRSTTTSRDRVIADLVAWLDDRMPVRD